MVRITSNGLARSNIGLLRNDWNPVAHLKPGQTMFEETMSADRRLLSSERAVDADAAGCQLPSNAVPGAFFLDFPRYRPLPFAVVTSEPEHPVAMH